jgi:hypothetical protein
MNKSTVAKMIADACKDAVRDAMRFVNTETAVAAPVAAPAKVADDVRAKRLAGLEKARAAKKAIAQARVATPVVAAPVAVVAKPVVSAAKPAKAWEVKDHTTKKGAKGKIVSVGPFSAWIPEGDKARKSAVIAAINLIRTDVSYEIASAIG